MAALLLLVATATGWLTYARAWDYFYDRSLQSGNTTLGLAANALNSMLLRYDPLPALIARRPLLQRVLQDPDRDGLLIYANDELKETAALIGASDVYLMDRSGLAIASSNHDLDRSFIGRRFDYRPYFTDALAGRTGRFHALGTTSGERGFFFAAPVKNGLDVIGVIAVKFTVSRMEDTWRQDDREILVADPNNVVFMASRDAWRFRTLGNPSAEMIEKIALTRQYPIERVKPMGFSADPVTRNTLRLKLPDSSVEADFAATRAGLIREGWHVIVLSPLSTIRMLALATVAVYVLAVLFVFFVILNILQRQARIQERFERHRNEQERLELMVQERTNRLNETNLELRAEIKERRLKEDQLRRTQKELIQTGKLAALGQISAALSHEINQPLSAVKSYAENALAFLERDRTAEVRENVARISMMADRMATISGHLRNFARRPQERIGPVPVSPSIEDALDLLEPKIKKSGVAVRYDRPEQELWAVGGRLRLQQVVVNLISNALDALADTEDGEIRISVSTSGDTVTISVRDNGPGIVASAGDDVFEPFFTTKEPGKGLGLGLSISYNIIKDFNGNLESLNHASGGAEFVIELIAAEPQNVAAQ